MIEALLGAEITILGAIIYYRFRMKHHGFTNIVNYSYGSQITFD